MIGMNKEFNQDFGNLRNWLNGNKISLYSSKTEVFYSNIQENLQMLH